MEVIRVTNSVARMVEVVRNLVKEDQDLQDILANGLQAIKSDLDMLSVVVKKTWAETNEGAKPEASILQLQDLAYDIEDFVYERGLDPTTNAPLRLVKTATVSMDLRRRFLSRIQYFQDRIKAFGTTMERDLAASAAAAPRPEEAPVAPHLVGVEQPIEELIELLLADGGHHQKQLKVISILGCSGLGKTTLAQALHSNGSIVNRFPYLVLVEAPSPPDPNHVTTTTLEVLRSILQKVGPQGVDATGDDHDQLRKNIRRFLRRKRYLVIIDDVQVYAVWDGICNAFPENGLSSRVIITTRNRSVALCCSPGQYIFTMRGLDGTHPADLFWARYGHDEDGGHGKTGWLETFFTKSEGLPLVLVAAADHLRVHGNQLTPAHCQDFENALGKHIVSGGRAFGKTSRALARCCNGLLELYEKMCMLSVSSFPHGQVMKKKSMIRRWIAEGLVEKDGHCDEYSVARGCLCNLLDQGIVEPVPDDSISTNFDVKQCQVVHGVMLEFLKYWSRSWNFTTLIEEGKVLQCGDKTARRLSIHGGGNIDKVAEKQVESSRIWSLTVRSTCSLILKRFKLLRILDLEGCDWLTNSNLDDVCGMLHLKYLSLRNTQVSMLPRGIGSLHCLETLDVRETEVDKLPLEVLKLPQITHLFGGFELQAQPADAKGAKDLEEFLSNESRLQTLAGCRVTNTGSPVLEQVLCHAKRLRKVKIWCEVSATPAPITTTTTAPPVPPSQAKNTSTNLSINNGMKSIANFFKKKNDISAANLPNGSVSSPESLVASLKTRFTGSGSLDSLSIHLGGHCQQFLASVLKKKCSVQNIKITGEMEVLTNSKITKLAGIRNIYELHLCNTGLLAENLSVLQNLHCLLSLKLSENREGFWQGDFIVNFGGFSNLQRLCFCGPKLPRVEFKQASPEELVQKREGYKLPEPMKSLHSLQLISLEPANELGVTGIIHLPVLKEVILHPDAPLEKMQAWKMEVNNHRNRPKIKKQVNIGGA